MTLDYQSLIDEAMLSIVKKILKHAQSTGLGPEQSFYISFRTDDENVMLSNSLKQRYPEEITIVLQHQFSDLIVMDNKFSVRLSFGGVPETIEVPFTAFTGFMDPSVNFSLQFRSEMEDDEFDIEDYGQEIVARPAISEVKMPAQETKEKKNATSKEKKKKVGEVIEFDKFRKKK